MRHDLRRKVAGACIAAALILTGPAHAVAASTDRPAVVDMIEQDFNGFFLPVTNGDGHYDIFQKLDDGLGVARDATVVCMIQDLCYLEVANMEPGVVAAYGEAGRALGGLRQRLAAVRDAYALMHSAPAEKREAGIAAWREAIGRLATCLASDDGCQ